MKYLSILTWWLLLLFVMQLSAVVLDGAHYLIWGLGGICFLKTFYLGFAYIVLFRYLSLRSEKSYEAMVESYNRIKGRHGDSEVKHKSSWLNPFLNIILVILSSADFTLAFLWSESIFRANVILDLVIWLLILRYVARAYWLKAQGKREKIKEFLDDSRSRMHLEDAPVLSIEKKVVPKIPFFALAILSLAGALMLTGWRWDQAARTYRVNDLKACMDKYMDFASERFYQKGQLEIELARSTCIQKARTQIFFSLDLHGGGIYLRGSEKREHDFFGNGKPGDQGLVLDPRGGFRGIWIQRPSE